MITYPRSFHQKTEGKGVIVSIAPPSDRHKERENLFAAAQLISFLRSDEFAAAKYKLAPAGNRLVICSEGHESASHRRVYFLTDQGLFRAYEKACRCQTVYRDNPLSTTPEPCTPMQLVRAYRRTNRRPSDLLAQIREQLAIRN
jgi:hypothetical protein